MLQIRDLLSLGADRLFRHNGALHHLFKHRHMLLETPFRLACTALCISLLSTAHAAASDPLSGTWKEVDDEQTTSVLRWERSGAEWIGKYTEVSPSQAEYGFRTGETIIRGHLKGIRFTGQVLLKNVDANPACPTVGLGWVPVKMELVKNGQRLHGSFRGTLVEENDECKVAGYEWRQYRLQKAE